MDIESFSYSVLTALIGMGVVFASLSALSVLMYLLRVVFEGRSASAAVDGAPQSSAQAVPTDDRSGANGGQSLLPTEVILGGVAHYLDYEERNRESSATAWGAGR